jgi:hypothetical protein
VFGNEKVSRYCHDRQSLLQTSRMERASDAVHTDAGLEYHGQSIGSSYFHEMLALDECRLDGSRRAIDVHLSQALPRPMKRYPSP